MIWRKQNKKPPFCLYRGGAVCVEFPSFQVVVAGSFLRDDGGIFVSRCGKRFRNGFGSGIGSLCIALAVGESFPKVFLLLGALALGFVAYGLSVYFYIYAQRDLGAAKTSTYYAVAPFVGAALSLLIFWELPSSMYLIAFVIMIIGTYFASTDGQKN